MAKYQLNVNVQRKDVNVDPSTPLLWVLREELKMIGTKYGCGISAIEPTNFGLLNNVPDTPTSYSDNNSANAGTVDYGSSWDSGSSLDVGGGSDLGGFGGGTDFSGGGAGGDWSGNSNSQ